MKKLLTFFCVAALLLPVLLTGCGSAASGTASSASATDSAASSEVSSEEADELKIK